MFSTRVADPGVGTRRAREGGARPTCSRSRRFPARRTARPARAARSTAAHAEPPLRLRSSPQPTRKNAGPDVGEQPGQPAMPPAATPRSPLRRARASTRRPRRGTRRRPSAWAARNSRSSGVLRDELTRDRQREHDVGAGPRREVQVGALRHRGAPRVDDHEVRARARCACVTSGGKCVLLTAGFAPQTTTSRGVHDVERVGREHVAEHLVPRLAEGRRADRVVDSRCAEAPRTAASAATVCSAGADEL